MVSSSCVGPPAPQARIRAGARAHGGVFVADGVDTGGPADWAASGGGAARIVRVSQARRGRTRAPSFRILGSTQDAEDALQKPCWPRGRAARFRGASVGPY